ncbi:MAG: aldo/keto reductase [Rhodospirillales bacterium]|nr:aldo/keto reductase [Rhodospirillales bacterium]
MIYVDAKGVRIPAIGLGTWPLRGEECERSVRAGLEIGYRHIDTAAKYDNEPEVGRGIAASGVARKDIFLVTKVWNDALRDGDLQRSAERSLKALRQDYVDLLLIHWPNAAIPLRESLKALASVKAKGRASHVGVSNFPVALLKEAVEVCGADLLCNQVEYHVGLSQRPVLSYIRPRGMMLTAYSPTAKGGVGSDALLKRIGAHHGKTPVQIALRWLVQQDGVAAIPKASNQDHARENFSIFDFELTPAEMAEISAIGGDDRLIDPTHGPTWDPA